MSQILLFYFLIPFASQFAISSKEESIKTATAAVIVLSFHSNISADFWCNSVLLTEHNAMDHVSSTIYCITCPA